VELMVNRESLAEQKLKYFLHILECRETELTLQMAAVNMWLSVVDEQKLEIDRLKKALEEVSRQKV
jgi:hypothetical protein